MYPRDYSKMPRLNPALGYIWDILSFFSSEEVHVPRNYYDQVVKVKNLLKSDVSGLVNTTLDFMVNCACVDYTIETSNAKLTERFDHWFRTVNSSLRGKVPSGIGSLAKEYFRERWKGSSFLLLRLRWEEIDGYKLPTQMWFMPGENIEVEDPNKEERVVGEEVYRIRLNNDQSKPFPDDEDIFVQKPFSSWLSEKGFSNWRGYFPLSKPCLEIAVVVGIRA